MIKDEKPINPAVKGQHKDTRRSCEHVIHTPKSKIRCIKAKGAKTKASSTKKDMQPNECPGSTTKERRPMIQGSRARLMEPKNIYSRAYHQHLTAARRRGEEDSIAKAAARKAGEAAVKAAQAEHDRAAS